MENGGRAEDNNVEVGGSTLVSVTPTTSSEVLVLGALVILLVELELLLCSVVVVVTATGMTVVAVLI